MEILSPDPLSGAQPSMRAALTALGPVTEILAREFAAGGTPEPQWNNCEWGAARAAVVIHGIAGLLARNSQWHGAPGWREFMQSQREHISARQRRIAGLLERIDDEARQAGVPFMTLKGAAMPHFGLSPPGTRSMSDLDLYVRPDDAEKFSQVLQRSGYGVGTTSWKHIEFEPLEGKASEEFGEHRDRRIPIDLHTSVRERIAGTVVDITRLVTPTSWGPGINDYPSTVALWRHLLLHTAANMSGNWLRAIQLHDVMEVSRCLQSESWQSLLDGVSDDEDCWWAWPPLCLASRYLPFHVPEHVGRQLARSCRPWLRSWAGSVSITQVSASNYKMKALPALPWSRSGLSAARYAIERVVPSRKVIASYTNLGRSRQFGKGESWFQISHPARILKWIFRRPARHGTTLALRAGMQSQFEDVVSHDEQIRP